MRCVTLCRRVSVSMRGSGFLGFFGLFLFRRRLHRLFSGGLGRWLGVNFRFSLVLGFRLSFVLCLGIAMLICRLCRFMRRRAMIIMLGVGRTDCLTNQRQQHYRVQEFSVHHRDLSVRSQLCQPFYSVSRRYRIKNIIRLGIHAGTLVCINRAGGDFL